METPFFTHTAPRCSNMEALTNTLTSLDLWLQKIIVGILTIFTSLLLPIFLCQFAILAACRKLAILFKPKHLQEPLAVQSAMIANMDDIYGNAAFSIVVPLFLQGKPDLRKIRATIRDKLLRKTDPNSGQAFYPELLQGVEYWMGYPFWRNLVPEENHATTEDLFLQESVKLYEDESGAEPCDWSKLQDITKYLCFKPYEMNRPLIEFLFIPNYVPDLVINNNFSESEEHSVAILRLHHLMADGYSILRLLECLSIATPVDRLQYLKAHDYTMKQKRNKGSLLMQAWNHAKLFMKSSYQVSEYLYQGSLYTAPGTLWDPEHLKDSNLHNARRKLELELYSSKEVAKIRCNQFKAAWSKPFSLQEINAIKSRFGVSGTAVMYSAIVGAMRKTMFSEEHIIPPFVGFALPLPLPRENGRLLNHLAFTTIFLLLREPDPIKRLMQVNDSIKRMKTSTLPVTATLLSAGVLGLAPKWIAQFVDREARKKEAILVSNVPGPKESFDLAGYRIIDCMWCSGQVIQSNYIFANLISSTGLVRLAIMGPQHLLKSDKNAERFVDSFFQELQLLKSVYP